MIIEKFPGALVILGGTVSGPDLHLFVAASYAALPLPHVTGGTVPA